MHSVVTKWLRAISILSKLAKAQQLRATKSSETGSKTIESKILRCFGEKSFAHQSIGNKAGS